VDQLLADEQLSGTAQVVWTLGDNENTVRDLATYNGSTTTVANHRVFSAYGQLLSQTNSSVGCLFAYTGRPLDQATGLQNNLNRWYDAIVGRWLSQDPSGFGGGDVNIYRYVGNSPANAMDPSGLWQSNTNVFWQPTNTFSPGASGNGFVATEGGETREPIAVLPVLSYGGGGGSLTVSNNGGPSGAPDPNLGASTCSTNASSLSKAGIGNYFGINDRNFWRWWDRFGKKEEPGRPDLQSRDEALKEYEDWVKRGRPDSEGHRTEPPAGEFPPEALCVGVGAWAAVGAWVIANAWWEVPVALAPVGL
jgi:RHS repeat-associated protein